MKFLTFEYQGSTYYGVKVKREESAWILPKLFADFGEDENYPKTLLEGISTYHTLDFQEIVRKLVEKARESSDPDQYKAPFSDIKFLAPVTPPNNVIALGRNYKAHAEEMKSKVESLYVFTKAASSLEGDEAVIPNHQDITNELDYEGELAVVIGKEAWKIDSSMALDYIYGYTILNDITARELQREHAQAFLAKNLKGSAPMGPFIVTKDELPNPESTSIVTKVNGEIRQDGSTSDMVLKLDELIAEISKYITLQPGDVIATGTPSGVGAGMNPPQFLKPGDEIRVSINGIGTLTTYIEK
ncbi:fumarylacetoacetate hydrolase family protein [Salinicoccus kekensis]|uniref:2-keto-4-pentenoate hydratase/2-oxohepta-3-ene-1,7-dioic acid hydratase in catechol pathway n=1 Tax=Salinicoccus kekensis TaxID=714307 RepID=A0A285UT92_9STAP|nr:fumarylacetoacetate hydrolase family protein [Salinicoccus kekensis]SOC45029.1 2-keto-4-pentenoate hydratase/2-oxohepta-3-ene-1,7-dioic acid hydratase in catechol pathway [Salinicoccus kekensis]